MLLCGRILIIVILNMMHASTIQGQTYRLNETSLAENNVSNTTKPPNDSEIFSPESLREHSETTTEVIYGSHLIKAFVNESVNIIESYLKSLGKKKAPKLRLNLQKKLRFLNETSNFQLKQKNNFTHKLAPNKRKSYKLSINNLSDVRRSQKWIWIAFELKGNCPDLQNEAPVVTSKKISSEISSYLHVNENLTSLNDIYCSHRKMSLNISVFRTTFVDNEFKWMQKFRHTKATISLLAKKFTVIRYLTKKSAIFIEKYQRKRSYKNYIRLLSYGYSFLAVAVLILASFFYCGRGFLNSRKTKSRFDNDLFMAFDEKKAENRFKGTNEKDVQNYYGNSQDSPNEEATEGNEEPTNSSTTHGKDESSNLIEGKVSTDPYFLSTSIEQRLNTSKLVTFQSPGPKPVYHDYDEVNPESENLNDTDDDESDFSDSEDPDECEEVDTSNLKENLWYIGNPLYTVRSTPDLGTSEMCSSKATLPGSTESLGLTRVQYVHGSTSFKFETDF